ncbi:lysophospholipase L1-like esterase [Roseimicrobium gellanilyticum]|uniref:Lysophospholipase L1-like esterase n=1 Tax=Roseimicrobium gellanilyticum TaxID=748857 RepID=A0A366HLG9_9BACT|nr:SGNH/GDSL hydrolase family protein [Roseimicrobium gellanilyticum]RBP43780.1 lysophospholipase L1-like esterase [Roseimicrobium gellanilyticum]
MHRLLLSLALVIACTFTAPLAAQSTPKLFTDGDTICFLGDSITHGGNWHRYIELFYVSRQPEKKINIVNCGIGGDRADGALKRLDWDVLVHQPTVIVIMLGMNDIGHGNYDSPNPTPEMLAGREKSITDYRKNMAALIEAIQKRSKAAIILVKPSPYDETAEITGKPARKGANGALAKCSEICGEFAQKYNTAVIDFHGPMTKLMSEGQKLDPGFALVGRDRVHPGLPGHLVMASLFLRGQGFTLHESGKLPIVTGVNDPVLAKIVPAEELMGSTTPAVGTDASTKKATEIATLSTERFTLGMPLRTIARMEVSMRGANIDPKDDAAVKTWMDERNKKMTPDTPAGKSWEQLATPYLKARAELPETLKKRQALLEKMRELSAARS